MRNLARVDVRHDLQEILDIVGEFRGALQLLPRPGFQDVGGAQFDDYFTECAHGATFKEEMKDFWFGDKVAAVPMARRSSQGKWLWEPASGSTAGVARDA